MLVDVVARTPNLDRRGRRVFRQLANRLCDDIEAAAGIAGARGLDGCVHRQQARHRRNARNGLGEARDLASAAAERLSDVLQAAHLHDGGLDLLGDDACFSGLLTRRGHRVVAGIGQRIELGERTLGVVAHRAERVAEALDHRRQLVVGLPNVGVQA